MHWDVGVIATVFVGIRFADLCDEGILSNEILAGARAGYLRLTSPPTIPMVFCFKSSISVIELNQRDFG
jgi:hypothetical protein